MVGPSQATILRCVQIQLFLVASLSLISGRRVAETLFYQQCCVCHQTLGEKKEHHVSQLYGSERNLINMKMLTLKFSHNLLN